MFFVDLGSGPGTGGLDPDPDPVDRTTTDVAARFSSGGYWVHRSTRDPAPPVYLSGVRSGTRHHWGRVVDDPERPQRCVKNERETKTNPVAGRLDSPGPVRTKRLGSRLGEVYLSSFLDDGAGDDPRDVMT